MFDDEFAGQGGTFELIKGKRRLVPGSRTKSAPATIDEPVEAAATTTVIKESTDAPSQS